jgi:hypothetical protein
MRRAIPGTPGIFRLWQKFAKFGSGKFSPIIALVFQNLNSLLISKISNFQFKFLQILQLPEIFADILAHLSDIFADLADLLSDLADFAGSCGYYCLCSQQICKSKTVTECGGTTPHHTTPSTTSPHDYEAFRTLEFPRTS